MTVTERLSTNVMKIRFDQHIARYKYVDEFISNNFDKSIKILDCASGIGYGGYLLSQKKNRTIYGIDISKESIKYANDNFNNDNIIFQQGNGLALPFDDNYFDIIISFETIEHIKNYENFLNEIKRVGKKGSIVFISTPNKDIFSPFIQKPLNQYHEFEWTPKENSNILRKYFNKCEFMYQEPPYSYRKILLRNYICGIINFCFLNSKFGKKLIYKIMVILQNLQHNISKADFIVNKENLIHASKENTSIFFKPTTITKKIKWFRVSVLFTICINDKK